MSDIAFIIVGILIGVMIFWKNPALPILLKADFRADLLQEKISVIIPARDEERNLALLLEDLQAQSMNPYEVICVDDQSEDKTSEIAKSFGVELVAVEDKPEGWTGKSWACQLGAEKASGELLLFLDADVRLSPNALASLVGAYGEKRCAVSVQPYHIVEKLYEQMSLFFNIVGIGANGISLPFKSKSVGLFGPVILISRENYEAVGGHYSVRSSVTDDLALGEALAKKNIEYTLFLGGEAIALRMYGGGINHLVEGWSKNYAIGAIKTSPIMLLLLVLWIGTYISVPLKLLNSAIKLDLGHTAVYSAMYTVLVFQLLRVSRRIGSFKKWASLIYPVPLAAFLAIFSISTFKKIFLGKTEWKGRKINLRR